MNRYYYWIALNRALYKSPVTFRKLVRAFGSPEVVFKAKDFELKSALRAQSESIIYQIKQFSDWDGVDKEIQFYEKRNVKILHFLDDEYPQILKEIHDYPPVIFIRGCYQTLNYPRRIAIVGSRKASHLGLDMASFLSKELSKVGLCIVSGFARGIDQAAHFAVYPKPGTIAVIGSGHAYLYPRVKPEKLYEFLELGCLLSEFPYDVMPLKFHFPRRNRVISGLSQGLILVEAKQKSGALITARLALESNRDVFVVPSHPRLNNNPGGIELIKSGAIVCSGPEDVIEEWQLEVNIKPDHSSKLEKDASSLLFHFDEARPLGLDEILKKSSLSKSEILAELTRLELEGLVRFESGLGYRKLML